MASNLFDKVWSAHKVAELGDGIDLIYIDRHLLYEGASSYAFESLRIAGRKVARPDASLAVVDHTLPTTDRTVPIAFPEARILIDVLERNCAEHGIPYFGPTDHRQGIVHVIGPEQGFTLPGITLVCADSHTATHGALGALAIGVGSSEAEHVLATQTLAIRKPKAAAISIDGRLGAGVSPKDLILAIIGVIGTDGAVGHVIEYRGSVIRELSMEGRMTVCNMSVEAGARAGLIAPDATTFAYVAGRAYAPSHDVWESAVAEWSQLRTDEEADFDLDIKIRAETVEPQVTWGTSPEQVTSISGRVPNPGDAPTPAKKAAWARALNYMDLEPGCEMTKIRIDKVFIGSCTNSRIEDLRLAAKILAKRRIASHVSGLVVPGSGLVKSQAESEGLDRVFNEAGLEWREPGCSMCLGMNPDRLAAGERCAATSNRNFEGRQGRGGRTHLVSPAVAAASAIAGHLADCRDYI